MKSIQLINIHIGMLCELCFNTKLHDFYKSDVLVVSLYRSSKCNMAAFILVSFHRNHTFL